MRNKWIRHVIRVPCWAVDTIGSFLTEGLIAGFHWEEDPSTEKASIAFYTPIGTPSQGIIDELMHRVELFRVYSGLEIEVERLQEEIPEDDWVRGWARHFTKRRLTKRFSVAPPWEELAFQPNETSLIIRPGGAFGTGLHESTRLCLEWIERCLLVDVSQSVRRALDLGTGSGILAIAMAKAGVPEVRALDVDEDAVREAGSNAALNGVEDIISFDVGSLERVEGMVFDLVIANLTGDILIGISSRLSSVVKRSSRAIISGFTKEEASRVFRAMEGSGLQVVNSLSEGQWCSGLLEMV